MSEGVSVSTGFAWSLVDMTMCALQMQVLFDSLTWVKFTVVVFFF